MKAYVDRCFLNHCLALARLARVRGPAIDRIARGADLWRRLRKWEARGARLALRRCNGPEFKEGEVERERARIVAGVLSVLGRRRLPGLFVDGDPRGHSLKMRREVRFGDDAFPVGRLPDACRDWGGYLVLAPEFGGRS